MRRTEINSNDDRIGFVILGVVTYVTNPPVTRASNGLWQNRDKCASRTTHWTQLRKLFIVTSGRNEQRSWKRGGAESWTVTTVVGLATTLRTLHRTADQRLYLSFSSFCEGKSRWKRDNLVR